MNELGSKLRSLRNAKNISLMQLSKLAECSLSYLSMVENGKVDPSVSRLKKIATALGVTVVDLFQSSNNQEIVLRKKDRIHAKFTHSKIDMEILVPPLPKDKKIDARLAIIHPDGGSKGDYYHPGEEFGLIFKGKLELTIDEISYQLEEGDSFYFNSTRRHSFRNLGSEDTVIVWVNHPPSW